MFKKPHFRSSFISLSLSLAISSSGYAWADNSPLKPEAIQGKTAIEIVNQLNTHHYRQQEINDSLSSRFLDEYLKTLDSAHMFLLAPDVKSFEKYRKGFDDDFKAGKLENGFSIYNKFSERFVARMEKVIAQLDDPKVAFNFDTNEDYMTDRKTTPWPNTSAEADKLWEQRIKAELLSSTLGGKTLEESRTTLKKRYATQLRYWNQQTSEEVYSMMMNALTMLFDPHTNYLSPDNSKDFNTSMTNKFQGIGAELQTDEDYTKVSRLIPGSPAEKQGQLKPNDKIVGVAQGEKGEMEDIIGWRLRDVVKKIKGPKDTIVRLEVIPADPTVTGHKIISIKRDNIELKDQESKKAIVNIKQGNKNYKIGIIDIPAFYGDFSNRGPGFASVSRDVYNILNELSEQDIDGIIVDLRNNGGGSLPEATLLTDLFIEPGPVVQIRQSNNSISRDYRATHPAYYKGPLIVMTNRLSASASEIFAGAIQDYGRGLIVGSTTFGKGSVQTLMPIEKGEGELKLTQQKFYRVSGDSTQHRGVIPDIELPNLFNTKEIGESAYDNALPWDQIHPAPHDTFMDVKSYVGKLTQLHNERIKTDAEFTFLTQQAQLFDEMNNKKVVSLNMAIRKKEQEALEKRTLEMENQKRKAKGEPLYANYAEYKAKETKKDEESQNRNRDLQPEKDSYLMETARIMADFINLQQPSDNKVATKK